MNKFPNSFFSDDVYAQFKARSMVMGRDTGLDVFLQNKIYNSAWITAVSSVDDFERYGGMTEEPGLAKFYVLSGGAVMWNGNTLVKREGINFESTNSTNVSNRDTAYYYTERSGLKPLPGITDFTITSMNRFGSVRKATIKFNVWSLDDLEVMDRLYFRPGYHLICEWGHTWGLNNQGQVVKSLAPVLKNYPQYFVRKLPEEITKLMRETRTSMSLNYDSFLGLITNFSWSFRTDLGYDCTIDVVSRGSVLESLTTKTGRPSSVEIETLGQQAPEDIHKTNFITRCLKVISSIEIENVAIGHEHNVYIKHFDNKIRFDTQFGGKEYSKDAQHIADQYRFVREKIKTVTYPGDEGITVKFENRSYLGFNKQVTVSDEAGDRPETITYIPLLVLFHIFNRFLTLTSSSTKIPRFNVKYSGEYLTFDNHVTLDPLVTCLPKAPVKWPDAYPLKATPLLVVQPEIASNTANYAFNIYVTEKTISEKLYDMLNTEGQAAEVNLYELMQGILGAINSALGGINELDLDFMEDTNEFVLIDRAMSSVYAFKNKEKVLNNKIIVAGLRSVATELSVNTKISKSLGSMIAIASQGDDTKSNMHLGEFKEWNKNLIDRFDPPPDGSAAANVAESMNTGNDIPDAPGRIKDPYIYPNTSKESAPQPNSNGSGTGNIRDTTTESASIPGVQLGSPGKHNGANPLTHGIGESAPQMPKEFQQKKFKNAEIPVSNLVSIGPCRSTAKPDPCPRYGGQFLLHPKAAAAWKALHAAAKKDGITLTVTSAYRDLAHQKAISSRGAAEAGSSPHGLGLAVDISEVYTKDSKGERDISFTGNANTRNKVKQYEWLAINGPKYGWWNPQRLGDHKGTMDESWHFEYWGPDGRGI